MIYWPLSYLIVGLLTVISCYPVIKQYVFDYSDSASHRRLITVIGVVALLIGWPVYAFNAIHRGISRRLGR